MEIDKNEEYTMLNDSLSLNFVYSKDELAAIYSRRDDYKNHKAEISDVEDFESYVRQNKSL